MTNAKHTPGPWHTVAKTSIADSHDYGICEVGTSNKTQEERFANARLIASAPELLEALENCMDYPCFFNEMPGVLLRQVRAAITKATGGQKP